MEAIKDIESQSNLLIPLATKGDQQALEKLLRLHEPFVYNVAWKYTNDQTEARDLTQDVLIKLMTKLSSFKGKSSFRTWAYRIAVNEFLMTKRRPMEDRWTGFDHFSDELNSIPSPELSLEEEKAEYLRTKTARTRCLSGMLMCLTREQRLIYLIGHVFNIESKMAAEIFDLSPDNFRQKLSRTRKEFHAFMNKQCGLVNLDNPCRCSKKAKAMEAAGKMRTDTRLFDPRYSATIAEFAEKVADEVTDNVNRKYIEFFRKHPSKKHFDKDTVVREILEDPELHKHFD